MLNVTMRCGMHSWTEALFEAKETLTVHRPEFLRVDPESIVSLDWSETWRP